ncbi:hypothetical protein Nmel_006078 [Mimus melanotis]
MKRLCGHDCSVFYSREDEALIPVNPAAQLSQVLCFWLF